MAAVRVWSVVAGLMGLLGYADRLYAFFVNHNLFAGALVLIWFFLWAPAALRVVDRQTDLRPRWYWIAVGTLGSLYILVPLWHRRNEFNSRRDKVISWLALFMLLIFQFVQLTIPR